MSVRIAVSVAVFLLFSLSLQAADYRQFRARYRATDVGDAVALAELAQWCEDAGEPAWSAICYRKIVKLGDTPQYRSAALNLAEYEIDKGRFESAYELLREVQSKFDDPRAKEILRGAETRVTQRQRDHLAKGDEFLARENVKKALQEFEKAKKLLPAAPSDRDYVKSSDIYSRIARCRELLDDQFYEEKVKPVEHDLVKCPSGCEQTGGFKKCGKCNGTGKIRKRVRRNSKWIYIWVTCGECGGYKWLTCAKCGGLEQVGQRITKKEKRALVKLIDKVRNLKIIKKRIDRATGDIESTLLREDNGSTLEYIRAQKPSYSISANLRNEFDVFPPSRAAFKGARDAWSQAGNDVRIRPNFLRSYAVEFSQFLRPFEMFRDQRRFSFDDAPEPGVLPEERVTPEELAAFPDDYSNRWLTVDGTMLGYRAHGKHGLLDVEADFDHNVRFFVWLDSARRDIEWFESSAWKSRVGDLADRYPFDRVHAAATETPVGHRVVLVGRLLRDRLGYPRNWFEVWDVQVGLSRKQDTLLEMLSEPVAIRFPGVQLSEIAEFLRWYGFELNVVGIDEKTRLTLEAEDCPIGTMLTELARVLGAAWYCEDKTIVLCLHGSEDAEAVRATRTVLSKIEGKSQGSVRSSLGGDLAGGPRPKGGTSDLESEEQLTRRVANALEEMDYATALTCYERLYGHSTDKARWDELTKLSHRVRIFDHLTRATAVSALGGGTDVVRISVRSPGGEVVDQHVKLLRQDADHWWVRPSYGGEVRLRADWIAGSETIAAADWRATKQREIERLERELTGSRARQEVNRLFVLALMAKTHRFQDRGTGYLDRVLAHPEFRWLIDTYFADRRQSILASFVGFRGEPDAGDEPTNDAEEDLTDIAEFDPETDDPDELLSLARSEIARGRQALSRALPGMSGASEQRKVALEHFGNASDCLDKVLAQKPDHADASKLADDVKILMHDCIKGLGFFD